MRATSDSRRQDHPRERAAGSERRSEEDVGRALPSRMRPAGSRTFASAPRVIARATTASVPSTARRPSTSGRLKWWVSSASAANVTASDRVDRREESRHGQPVGQRRERGRDDARQELHREEQAGGGERAVRLVVDDDRERDQRQHVADPVDRLLSPSELRPVSRLCASSGAQPLTDISLTACRRLRGGAVNPTRPQPIGLVRPPCLGRLSCGGAAWPLPVVPMHHQRRRQGEGPRQSAERGVNPPERTTRSSCA